MNKFLLITTILMACSVNNSSYATFAPLPSRLTITGTTGQSTFGKIDGMVPVVGNSEQMMYLDADGRYGQHRAWYGSVGTGYRGVVNQSILGAYVFGEREHIARGTLFWMVNPGIEMMTNNFDAHINGYFPAGKQTVNQGNYFGDQIGRENQVQRGHTQYNELYNKVQVAGRGTDAELGITFANLNHTRVYGGGYYFNFKDAGSTDGYMGGVTVPINHYVSVGARDTYDKHEHNTASVILEFTFGGIVKYNCDTIGDRMLDPIERHVAATDGRGLPTSDYYNEKGLATTGYYIPRGLRVERDDIWYFTNNGGSAFNSNKVKTDGTYEHPYNSAAFDQTTLDAIHTVSPVANLYLAPGTYQAVGDSNTLLLMTKPSALTINAGQTMWGRNADYQSSAANKEVMLAGSLDLNSNDSLNDIWLHNNDTRSYGYDYGITVADNAINININNTQVGAPMTTTKNGGYDIGIMNGGNTTINNSIIYAGEVTNPASTIGIENSGILTIINNSQINATAMGTLEGPAEGVYNRKGIMLIDHSSINVDSDTLATGISDGSAQNAMGKPTVTIQNGSVINATATAVNAKVTGLFNAFGTDVIDNSTINVKDAKNFTDDGSIYMTGILSDHIVIVRNSSQVNVTNNATAIGLENLYNGNSTIDNSSITVIANSAIGLINDSRDDTANIINHSIINVTSNGQTGIKNNIVGVDNFGTVNILSSSQVSAVNSNINNNDALTVGLNNRGYCGYATATVNASTISATSESSAVMGVVNEGFLSIINNSYINGNGKKAVALYNNTNATIDSTSFAITGSTNKPIINVGQIINNSPNSNQCTIDDASSTCIY